MDKNNHTKEEIQMKECDARFVKRSQLKEDAEDENSGALKKKMSSSTSNMHDDSRTLSKDNDSELKVMRETL